MSLQYIILNCDMLMLAR